ncbi:MAG: ComF family protein [Pseudomonadota bacterium]
MPAPCHLCNRDTLDGAGLCPACRREWRALAGRSRCPGCGLAMPRESHAEGPMRCGACRRRPRAFDGVVAAVDLDPSVRHVIHRLKYHHDFSVLPLLEETLIETVLAQAGDFRPEALVPMPVHPAQRRRRGFNQAQLLAGALGRALGVPVAEGEARRVRDAGSLAALDAAARRRALRGAFEVSGSLPGRVAIVDDVLTTGASAEALTLALRRAGVREVAVWVVARTP